jgi:hypothetical protein
MACAAFDPPLAARRVPRIATAFVQIFSSQRAFVGRYALGKLLIVSAAMPRGRGASLFLGAVRSNTVANNDQRRCATPDFVMPTIAAGCGFAMQRSSVECARGRR